MKAFIAAVLAVLALPASAQQPQCGPLAQLHEHLAKQYDEHPAGEGATEHGMLARVYASPAGTWTFVLIRPDGIACVATMGEGWQQSPVKAPGKDA
jgi:hypothetical protein